MPDLLDGPRSEAIAIEPKRMTAEEFAAKHENDRVELIDGYVVEKAMPNREHGWICAMMSGFLFVYLRERDIGRAVSHDGFISLRGVERGRDTVYGPDIAYFSYERMPRGPISREVSDTVPEIAVEVKSPSDSWSYVFGKMGDYLRGGVSVVVILDPESQSGSVYRANANQTTLGIDDTLTIPEILPGFEVRVGDLFGV